MSNYEPSENKTCEDCGRVYVPDGVYFVFMDNGTILCDPCWRGRENARKYGNPKMLIDSLAGIEQQLALIVDAIDRFPVNDN